jgi:hypothetical protein
MKKSFKQWVYHATKSPKVINSDQFEEFEASGWADSPAKFAKIVDFGVDESNAEHVQALGEAIEGVKDAANGALNIDVMDKKQLEDYANKNFNVDIDRRKGIKQLRKQVKELAGV